MCIHSKPDKTSFPYLILQVLDEKLHGTLERTLLASLYLWVALRNAGQRLIREKSKYTHHVATDCEAGIKGE
jgi:hypothetical protein